MKPTINIRRVYEKPLKKDGYRVLVDRLWPRGLETEAGALDEWAKGLAPSVHLRKWFGHDPDLWLEFQKKIPSRIEAKQSSADFPGNSSKQKSYYSSLWCEGYRT